MTVLIGIAYKGRAVAGVIHQPFFGDKGRTIWGIQGVGTFGVDLQKPGTCCIDFRQKL